MSFNTSNIQADTFTGVYSVSAPIHYVDGIPISNNTGNLKLGNETNNVVECLELESLVSVSSQLGDFNLVSTAEIDPSDGIGTSLLMNGYLNFNNYGLTNVNTLSLGNGATGQAGQFLSIGATGALFWTSGSTGATGATGSQGVTGATGASGNPTTWASFPALANVNVNFNELLNVNKLTVHNGTGGYNQVLSVDGSGFAVWKNENTASNWSSFKATQAVDFDNQAINKLKYLTLENNAIGLQGQVLSIGANDELIWKTDANDASQWSTFDAIQSVNINNNALQNVLSISGVDNEISVNDDLVLQNKDIYGVNRLYVNKIYNTYNLEKVIYVSPNGDDNFGSGNILNPFKTIQTAIDVAQTDSQNVYYYIMVMAGTYNENLTISKKINLIGMASSPYNASVGCVIGGSVTININSNGGDIFNNACNISGFLIGSLVSFVSTANSILNIENCYLYSDDNISGRALYFNPSCANSRLRLTNTIIISGGSAGLDPLIEITSVSQTTMNNCYFSAKGLQNVLKFSGSATCDTINTVKFESANTGANVSAIVEITATVSATYTFSNCGFLYASTTNKSANAQASGIYSNSSTGNNRIVALYCSFFLLGTSSSLNYAIQDAYHGGASQMIVLYYMNGASLQNAFAIHANNNQNKFQLQIVS